MPGAQGHSTDPIRVAESPRDAAGLLCAMASPWSADFTGILLVRALSFSPAATGRSQDSTWIWLQSASSLCKARTSNYLWSFGSGCLHCGICLYSCSTGSTPPSEFHPLSQQPHMKLWLSQLRETGDRETQGTPEQVSGHQETRTPWPGHETLRMPKVFKSSFKHYCVGMSCLKSLGKHWKKLFFYLSHGSFRWGTQS